MAHNSSNTTPDQPDTNGPRLDETVRLALDHYFKLLGDQSPHALHDMVMDAVEKPLLCYVIERYAGNVSHASQALGITRSTLRAKLKRHGLTPLKPLI
jgi:Fis family transcriptional regulator, factor for inversion stimulation protein